jgi:uncharacterized membrane protein YkvA (DUF1232 family)
MFANLRNWARDIKRDVLALWLAARDPRTPWYAKAVATAVAAYALSPIDLVPDFIPVVGYLDDIILVPLGILLAIKLIPPDIMEEHRRRALAGGGRPRSRVFAGIIIAIWVIALALVLDWLFFDPAFAMGTKLTCLFY